MKIKVEATTKETKTTRKGSVYTGVKIEGGDWVNIYGNHVGKKGQILNISEPKTYSGTGTTKWAQIESVQSPEQVADSTPRDSSPDGQKTKPPQEQSRSGPEAGISPEPSTSRKTLQQYFITLDLVCLHVKKLEPDSPEARATLINNIMNLWAEGKII